MPGGRLFGRSVGHEVHFVSDLEAGVVIIVNEAASREPSEPTNAAGTYLPKGIFLPKARVVRPL